MIYITKPKLIMITSILCSVLGVAQCQWIGCLVQPTFISPGFNAHKVSTITRTVIAQTSHAPSPSFNLHHSQRRSTRSHSR